MTPSIVSDEPKPGVRRLTFSNPEVLNAFTWPMYDQLLAMLDEIKYDTAVRVVVLTGAGRGFCSGNFVGGPSQPSWVAPGIGKPQFIKYTLEGLARIPLAIRGLPQPVIAAVNGVAAGIGLTFALAADMAIAGQSAKFVNAIHNAGTGTELGMSYLLPRAVGAQRAAEILYTARPILADEAARIGLVLKTVPDDQLMEEALALADSIIVNSPIGIWLTKQSFQMNQDSGSFAAAIEIETRGVITSQMTEDAVEKRRAFMEKRAPQFKNT